MHDGNQTESLTAIVGLLRRNALLIGFTIALAVAGSIVLSAMTSPRYTAQSAVAFNDDSTDLQALGIPAAPSFQPDKEAAAQAERITRPDVVDQVRRKLKLTEPVPEIQADISTQVEPSSNLVEITAKSATARGAADLANALATAVRRDATDRSRSRYRAVAAAAQNRAARLSGKDDAARRAVYEDQAARLLALANFAQPVDVVRTAEVPSSPSSPKPVRNAILAALLGGILGIALTFMRQALDRRLREQSDVEEQIDAPVLTYVSSETLGSRAFSPDGDGPDPEHLEPFRILRSNVAFLPNTDDATVLLVSSPLPEEGKSTVALGLAWAEALAGRRTLLVDCDLRRPTIAERLGLEARPGLSEFLAGEAQPHEVLRTVEVGGSGRGEPAQLVCIPAGRPSPDHAELLSSDVFARFLEQVSEAYDRVVLDSAPLLPVSDTLEIVPRADAILLCLRMGKTTRDDTRAARAALAHFPTKPVGVVLTAADKSERPYYVGSYAYAGAAAD